MNGSGRGVSSSEKASSSSVTSVPQALLSIQTYFTQHEKEKLAWARERQQLRQRVRELEDQLLRLSGASGAGAAAADAATATLRARRTGSGNFVAEPGHAETRPVFPGVSPDKKYQTFGGRLKNSLFKGSLRRNSILKQFLVTFGLNDDKNDGGASGRKDAGNSSPNSSSSPGGTPQPASPSPARQRSLSSGSNVSTKNTDLSHIEKLSDKALDDMQRLMIQNTTKGGAAAAKLRAYQRDLEEMRRASGSGSDSGGGEGGSLRIAQRSATSLFGVKSVFRAHVGGIHALHACSDGRRFLTGSDDGLVKLWSVTNTSAASGSGQCDRVLRGAATGPVYATAYVPSEGGGTGSGGLVLAAGRDPAINIWRVGAAGSDEDRENDSPFTSTQIRAHSDAVWAIVPRGGNSGQILSVGADGFASFLDVHSFLRLERAAVASGQPSVKPEIVHRFAFESQVSAATPNPTAATFLHGPSAGRGGGCVVAFDVSTLIHFDLETGRRVATLNPDAARPVDLHPYCVVCDPSTGLIFSGHESGDILCWDVRTNGASVGSSGGKKSNGAGCDFRFPKAHDKAVCTLCIDQASSGGVLVSGSADGDVKVWDLRSTSSTTSSPTQTSLSSSASCCKPMQKIVQAHLGGVFGLQQFQRGQQMISCGADGIVRFYERRE